MNPIGSNAKRRPMVFTGGGSMKSSTHSFSAMAVSPVFITANPTLGADVVFTVIGFLFASKAPDWLEIPRWENGNRTSVLPHRTVTHTWWVWVLAWIAAKHLFQQYHFLFSFLSGFCAGALWHILADAMTPMGVPVLNPFGRRWRMRVPLLRTDIGFSVLSLAVGVVCLLSMK